jgi:hypothetical protein
LQSTGQNALDAAGLSYGNAVDIANLGQSNANTLAANKTAQAKADGEAAAVNARGIQGIGQLGLYGAGMYYGGGNPLSGLFDRAPSLTLSGTSLGPGTPSGQIG